MSAPVLRDAVLADAQALSALAEQTFIETFVEDFAIPYPPADLRSFCDACYSVEASAKLICDPALRVRVAERDGQLLGYSLIGPCGLPHTEASKNHGELRRLYVLRTAHGTGLGRALLDDALDALTQRFGLPLWLGVWSGNQRAQAIYQARGFHKVGEYDFLVGAFRDREFILRKDA